MPRTPFVVAAHPRTGSNWLCGTLNSHPSVLCHFEAFHPEGVHYAPGFRLVEGVALETVEERDADARGFLDRLLAQDLGHDAVGLKLMPGHAPGLAAELFADASVRKFVLHRENRVRVFLSVQRAVLTGFFAHESYDGVRVAIDPDELLAFAEGYDGYYRDLARALRGQDALWLSYERLFTRGSVARALDFLGVAADEALLRPRLARQSSDSLRAAIANFDELAEALAGTRLHADLVLDERAATLASA
jgi:hypothetical protein